MIKGVAYDMDDLMVRSDELHSLAWDGLLNKYAHSFDEIPKNIQAGFIGRRVIDILKEILNYFNLEIDLELAYQERTEIFLKIVEENLQAMPGLETSLQLFKQNGYKVALASSGAKRYINLVLERFNISEYFDVIVSGDDVSIGKPHPETYLVAAKKLGILPEECLVLEDATKGVAAAKAAGCRCVAIINPYTLPQDHTQADLILPSLEKITLNIVRDL